MKLLKDFTWAQSLTRNPLLQTVNTSFPSFITSKALQFDKFKMFWKIVSNTGLSIALSSQQPGSCCKIRSTIVLGLKVNKNKANTSTSKAIKGLSFACCKVFHACSHEQLRLLVYACQTGSQWFNGIPYTTGTGTDTAHLQKRHSATEYKQRRRRRR